MNCADTKLAAKLAAGETDLLLTTLGGLPLTDPTAYAQKAAQLSAQGLAPSSSENEMLQSARFLDSQVFFKTHELIALIDATAGVDAGLREDFFCQLISSRKRAYTSWRKLPIQKLFDMEDSNDLRKELRLCADLNTLLAKPSCRFSATPESDRLSELCTAVDYDNTNWIKQMDLHEQLVSIGMTPSDASELIRLITFSVDHSERDEEESALSVTPALRRQPSASSSVIVLQSEMVASHIRSMIAAYESAFASGIAAADAAAPPARSSSAAGATKSGVDPSLTLARKASVAAGTPAELSGILDPFDGSFRDTPTTVLKKVRPFYTAAARQFWTDAGASGFDARGRPTTKMTHVFKKKKKKVRREGGCVVCVCGSAAARRFFHYFHPF